MADKFRITYPIAITFADGEQPTSGKLNAISQQSKSGLALAERAIGDVWNQSGDSTYVDYPLQIVNLARVMGEQENMNALMHYPDMSGAEEITITQDITGQMGRSIIQLDFLPIEGDPSTLHTSLSAAGKNVRRTSLANIAAENEYYVDTATGTIHFGGPWPLVTYTSLDYDVLGTDLPTDGSSASHYNVIPHPNMSSGWKGLKFYKVTDNKYLIYLPVRRPLSGAGSQIGKIPRVNAGGDNSGDVTTGTDHAFWYPLDTDWLYPADVTANANHFFYASAKRYRYRLPTPIYDAIVAGPTGTTLPSNSLYLWDGSTKTIVEGLTFKVPENDAWAYGGAISPRPVWVIQVEGAQLDELLNGVDSSATTDDPPDYDADFALIAAGEGVAQKLNQLSELMIDDGHNLSTKRRLSHSDLLDLQPSRKDASDNYQNFPASWRANDGHVDLLSRHGSRADSTDQRDLYNNGMQGNLLMLSTSFNTDYQNLDADSWGISWGDVATGPEMLFTENGANIIHNDTTVKGTTDCLTIQNTPFHISSNILFMSQNLDPNSVIGGLQFDDVGDDFRFFSRADIAEAGVSMGKLLIIGESQLVTASGVTFNGTDSATWVEIDSGPSSSAITFDGGDLSFESQTTSDNVLIGSSAGFSVLGNQYGFGALANNDRLEFDTVDTFTFVANNAAASAVVRGGVLWASATSNQIDFGAVSRGNDYINFNDTTNIFQFVADADVDNAQIEVGGIDLSNDTSSTIAWTGGVTISRDDDYAVSLTAVKSSTSLYSTGSLYANAIRSKARFDTGNVVGGGSWERVIHIPVTTLLPRLGDWTGPTTDPTAAPRNDHQAIKLGIQATTTNDLLHYIDITHYLPDNPYIYKVIAEFERQGTGAGTGMTFVMGIVDSDGQRLQASGNNPTDSVSAIGGGTIGTVLSGSGYIALGATLVDQGALMTMDFANANSGHPVQMQTNAGSGLSNNESLDPIYFCFKALDSSGSLEISLRRLIITVGNDDLMDILHVNEE